MFLPGEKCCLQNGNESHTLNNGAESTNKTLDFKKLLSINICQGEKVH